MNIGIISYSLATVGYFLLAGLMTVSWRGRPLGGVVILSALATALWALLSVFLASGLSVSPLLVELSEFVRNICWLVLLANILRLNVDGSDWLSAPRRYAALAFLLMVAFLLLFVVPFLNDVQPHQWQDFWRDARLIVWMAIPVVALICVEQVIRNASTGERWVVKYLCIGVGLIFVYDFFMYADALLYKQLSPEIWQARGVVVALAVPMIAVAIARNPRYDIRIHVSRDVVFHSVTIVGAGVYLLLMAVTGYLIKLTSSSLGGALQIVFLFGAALFLAVLLFSDAIRTRMRVFLSKHFFSYKHDYREQWLRFTQAMAEGEVDVPERIIRAVSGLMGSGAGMLFETTGKGGFRLLDRWNMADLELIDGQTLNSLFVYLERTGWIVDFDEYRVNPSVYDGLELPQWLQNISDAWLIVPLPFKSEVIGFVLVKRSDNIASLNWEDRDLLKMSAMQAAIHLAQYQADKSLREAHQFDSFNRLSAYVVHDLKNILAQQSLILANAEKHRNNPAFVDDVFLTIGNSVERMQRLMQQMRDGARGEEREEVSLEEVLRDVVRDRGGLKPVPVFASMGPATVTADPSQLKTVFAHIIQNAQEATADDGKVSVTLRTHERQALVCITDTGKGMSDTFVRERLFMPFDSTKGLMGMGIGVHESRNFVRSLGGDVSVQSEPGKGTNFIISLPVI